MANLKGKGRGKQKSGFVKGGQVKKRVPQASFGVQDLLSQGLAAEKSTEFVITEAGDPVLQEKLDRLTPQQVALVVVWNSNGRNASAAGKLVGYHPTYARKLFAEHTGIQEVVAYLDAIGLEDREWLELLPEARMTMRSLLQASDPKVRYLAAKDIVDRVEGKPTIKIDKVIRDERPSLSDGQMQLAMSLMHAKGLNFAQARQWVLEHPAQADAWISANANQKAKQLPALAEGVPQDVSDLSQKEDTGDEHSTEGHAGDGGGSRGGVRQVDQGRAGDGGPAESLSGDPGESEAPGRRSGREAGGLTSHGEKGEGALARQPGGDQKGSEAVEGGGAQSGKPAEPDGGSLLEGGAGMRDLGRDKHGGGDAPNTERLMAYATDERAA